MWFLRVNSGSACPVLFMRCFHGRALLLALVGDCPRVHRIHSGFVLVWHWPPMVQVVFCSLFSGVAETSRCVEARLGLLSSWLPLLGHPNKTKHVFLLLSCLPLMEKICCSAVMEIKDQFVFFQFFDRTRLVFRSTASWRLRVACRRAT